MIGSLNTQVLIHRRLAITAGSPSTLARSLFRLSLILGSQFYSALYIRRLAFASGSLKPAAHYSSLVLYLKWLALPSGSLCDKARISTRFSFHRDSLLALVLYSVRLAVSSGSLEYEAHIAYRFSKSHGSRLPQVLNPIRLTPCQGSLDNTVHCTTRFSPDFGSLFSKVLCSSWLASPFPPVLFISRLTLLFGSLLRLARYFSWFSGLTGSLVQ